MNFRRWSFRRRSLRFRSFRRRSLLLLLAFAAGASGPACTYGPVQERTRIENADERFNTHTFAVALDWLRFREPTGISTFPDGGSAIVLAEQALFYVCDADSPSARLLARIDRPKEMESGFAPWIVGWGDDGFYAKITGSRYSWRRGSVGGLNTWIYRIGLDGTCIRVRTLPESVRPGTDTGIRLPGEETFLRVGRSSDSIDVAVEPGEIRWGAFVVDQKRGTLVPGATLRRART